MRYIPVAIATVSALLLSVPAAAGNYNFSFTGVGEVGSGVFTTSDTPMVGRGGYTAFALTGITGMLNGSMITGLGSAFGSNNLYYTTGPSFVDGSGIAFTTAAGSTANLFYQDSIPTYRVNQLNPFNSVFVTATSSAAGAVPEPASWAMMISGFGLVGAAARRTRRTVNFAV